MSPADHDLTVEYRLLQSPPTKMWCVVHHGNVLAVESTLDAALAIGRELAKTTQCDAWLIAGEAPKPIALP